MCPRFLRHELRLDVDRVIPYTRKKIIMHESGSPFVSSQDLVMAAVEIMFS